MSAGEPSQGGRGALPGAGGTPPSGAALFAIPSLIWGSTWLAITGQLGTVEPEVSVVYRFAIASALLVAACLATRRPLRFGARDHAFLAALGLAMICVNYLFVYHAERYIASGLVAVAYSTVVFMTPVAMRIVHGAPLRPRLLAAATLGVAGVWLLFLPQVDATGDPRRTATGVALTLAAAAACAVGNVVAVRNQKAGIPTVSGTAWMLVYGTLFALVVVAAQGAPWRFDASPRYVLSLVYLAVFGSVVAFATYFALLERVGAGPSSYVAVVTPVIAMLLSTLFEGYRWNALAVAGGVLAVIGNRLVLAEASGAGAKAATPKRSSSRR